jgi:hypothetical protein
MGIVAAVVVLVAGLAFFLTRDDGKKDNVAADRSDQSDQSDQSDSRSSDRSTDSSDSSTATEVPAGFKVLEDTTEGVSIAVPKDFREIDPALFLDSSNQSDFSDLNPDLAPFLSSGNSFLAGSVLAASGSTDGTPAFVVVTKTPQRFDPTDPRFSSELETQLQTAGGTNITTDPVSLPAGDGLRVGVTLTINGTSSTGTVDETLFFVTVGRTTWGVIGVSVGGSERELFDQIAQTFTVSS